MRRCLTWPSPHICICSPCYWKFLFKSKNIATAPLIFISSYIGLDFLFFFHVNKYEKGNQWTQLGKCKQMRVFEKMSNQAIRDNVLALRHLECIDLLHCNSLLCFAIERYTGRRSVDMKCTPNFSSLGRRARWNYIMTKGRETDLQSPTPLPNPNPQSIIADLSKWLGCSSVVSFQIDLCLVFTIMLWWPPSRKHAYTSFDPLKPHFFI